MSEIRRPKSYRKEVADSLIGPWVSTWSAGNDSETAKWHISPPCEKLPSLPHSQDPARRDQCKSQPWCRQLSRPTSRTCHLQMESAWDHLVSCRLDVPSQLAPWQLIIIILWSKKAKSFPSRLRCMCIVSADGFCLSQRWVEVWTVAGTPNQSHIFLLSSWGTAVRGWRELWRRSTPIRLQLYLATTIGRATFSEWRNAQFVLSTLMPITRRLPVWMISDNHWLSLALTHCTKC